MKEYMLFFRFGLDGLTPSPEQMQQGMVKWKTWLDKLAKDGNLGATGQRLAPAGTTLRGKEKRVVDGPFAEGKEILGGYMTVKARDMNGAVEIAKGCPIFDTGGSAEVREIMANQTN